MNVIKQHAKILKCFVFYRATQETEEKEKIEIVIIKPPKGHSLQFALAQTDWREKESFVHQ